jgi:predicted kinase
MSDRGRVLILTGPPGSGKTTVGQILASRFEPTVHLETDDFFHFIRSGYIEPWKSESREQNEVVMGVVGEAATGYANGGFFTIVEGIILPGWSYEPLLARFSTAGIEVSTVILRSSLETCRKRAQYRASDPLEDPAVVEKLWLGFSDLGVLESQVIVTDMHEPEVTADAVVELLIQARPSI